MVSEITFARKLLTLDEAYLARLSGGEVGIAGLDDLYLAQLLQTCDAALAAKPGMFVAAERITGRKAVFKVKRHRAGVDARGIT